MNCFYKLFRNTNSAVCALVLFSLWFTSGLKGDAKKGEVPAEAWMSSLPSHLLISSLTIPGTHNSGALYEPLRGTAACQRLTIVQQLEAGVRFFDIRCRHESDQFAIYHGPVFQHLTYAQIEKTMAEFLRKHPNEVLIASIKQESSPRRNTRSFEDTIREYISEAKALYFTETTIPKLGEARGKIVLLRRFASENNLGIAATNWGHNGFYQGRHLFVQDRFELRDVKTKWELVERGLEHSIQSKNQGLLHLNFTSGYVKNVFGIPNIVTVSNEINQKLANYLAEKSRCRLGCVVTDFMTPKLSRYVFKLNFERNPK